MDNRLSSSSGPPSTFGGPSSNPPFGSPSVPPRHSLGVCRVSTPVSGLSPAPGNAGSTPFRARMHVRTTSSPAFQGFGGVSSRPISFDARTITQAFGSGLTSNNSTATLGIRSSPMEQASNFSASPAERSTASNISSQATVLQDTASPSPLAAPSVSGGPSLLSPGEPRQQRHVDSDQRVQQTSGVSVQKTKSLRSLNLDFAWLALDEKNLEEREKLMKAALEDILDQSLKIARELVSNSVSSCIETALNALSQVDERQNDAKKDRVQAMSLALYQIVADATRLGNPGTDSVAASPSAAANNNSTTTTGKVQLPSSEASRDDSCVICQERPRESAFIPCGHLVCCVPCAKELEDRSRSGSGSSLIPGASSNAAFGSSISTPASGAPVIGASSPAFAVGSLSSTSGVVQTISGSSAVHVSLSPSGGRPFGVSSVAVSNTINPVGTTHRSVPVFGAHPVRSLSWASGNPGEEQFKCPVCRVWCKGYLRIWK